MKQEATITIIVPIFNEQSVVRELYTRLRSVTSTLNGFRSEILFVDDGSTDNSEAMIKDLQDQDAHISYVQLSRNFGKEAAISAGLDYSDSDISIVIDADLQDPPEVIPEMLDLWSLGYDVVYGQRIEREGDSLLKRLTAKWFYRTISHLGGRISIPKDTGDFRLLSRRAVIALRQLRETNRFMKGLFTWIGYKQAALPYRRDRRHSGMSKYNYWKLWNFALDGITSFTTIPLKLASYVGALIGLAALLYGLVIVIKTLVFGEEVQGYPSLMVAILFLGGIQLFFLGIAGEYQGRMFEEAKRRPLYFVSESRLSPAAKLPTSASRVREITSTSTE